MLQKTELDPTVCAAAKINNVAPGAAVYFLIHTGTAFFKKTDILFSLSNKADISGHKHVVLAEPGNKIPMEINRPDDRNELAIKTQFYEVPVNDISDFGVVWPCAFDYIPIKGYRFHQDPMTLLPNVKHLLKITVGIGNCDILIRIRGKEL